MALYLLGSSRMHGAKPSIHSFAPDSNAVMWVLLLPTYLDEERE